MAQPRWKEALVAVVMMATTFYSEVVVCKEMESPQFTVLHSESDFEVRFYRESVWMTAHTDEISFDKATRDGFHRLFQYIEGANLNFSRISMTVPVLTSIVPGAGPLHSSAYFVKLYLPEEFQAEPPSPLPELNLRPDSWTSHCIAVRKFSGFARDRNIVKEAEKLALSLSRSPWANSTSASEYAYSIAQYNSPFKIIGRVNEVWVDVSGSEANGCKPGLVAAY
nr:heme-binding protein 2-like [Ipomoea trifida]GMC48278.1 heme-binding protein 2-like [Ipomoea batatas]